MTKFNRIKISRDATSKLNVLKARTGLTPNILCRIALCFSVNNGKINHQLPSDEDGQEFNRYTLTGEYDLYFVSLVKERCFKDGLDPSTAFLEQFKLHINNGIYLIYGRVRDISDIVNLLEGNKNETANISG